MNLDEFGIGGIKLEDVLIVIVIAVLTIFTAKILNLYVNRTLRKRMTLDHVKIITKVIYITALFIGALLISPIIGFDASGLVVAGGILAIILGFASQSIVGNLISGLFLIFERPIKVGDVVDIDSTIGQVEDIRIISTTIRTFDGYFVRIPNMTVFNNKIINFFVNKARRFEYEIGIRYRDDADKAVRVIEDTIEKHPFALVYPEPMIFVDSLGDSSVNIIVKIWAPFTEWYDVKRDLLWKIKADLEENGIAIPFQQHEIWFRNDMRIDREP